MIAPIPILYYAGMVRNGLLTANLVIAGLSNKSTRTILPTFNTYGLHSHRNSSGSRWYNSTSSRIAH